MKKIMLTCPLTGCEFELKIMDNHILPFTKATTHHPLIHQPIEIYMNEHFELCIPYKYFEHLETLTPIEAASVLGVTRQRISQIINDNVIPSHIINGSPVLLKTDVVSYLETRKTGRPAKEV